MYLLDRDIHNIHWKLTVVECNGAPFFVRCLAHMMKPQAWPATHDIHQPKFSQKSQES